MPPPRTRRYASLRTEKHGPLETVHFRLRYVAWLLLLLGAAVLIASVMANGTSLAVTITSILHSFLHTPPPPSPPMQPPPNAPRLTLATSVMLPPPPPPSRPLSPPPRPARPPMSPLHPPPMRPLHPSPLLPGAGWESHLDLNCLPDPLLKDDSKCSSAGGDCCAPPELGEEASCRDGFVPIRLTTGCFAFLDGLYTCVVILNSQPCGHALRPNANGVMPRDTAAPRVNRA